MGVTDGKILLPTSIGEVAELLGENTRDLAKICASNNINKFSRFKPIDATGFQNLLDADRKAANNGLKVPGYNSLASLRLAVLSAKHKWEYLPPQKTYRLTDFDGYNHINDWDLDYAGNAIFGGSVTIGSEDEGLYDGTPISLYIDYYAPSGDEYGQLYPIDWDETSINNLRSLRLGLILLSPESETVWFRGNGGSLSEGFVGVSSLVPASVESGKSWFVVPILTDRQSDYFVSSDVAATYIPLEGTYIRSIKQTEDPYASLFYSAEGVLGDETVELEVEIRNTTTKSTTVHELYLVISSERAYDSSWGRVEVAVSTWLTENKLDDILPEPGGALLDGSGKICQRLYRLDQEMANQFGSRVVPALSSAKFAVSIPATGDDYGPYDQATYTAFLINDSHNGYDASEFDVYITTLSPSCFAHGYWDNSMPWTNSLGWNNTP